MFMFIFRIIFKTRIHRLRVVVLLLMFMILFLFVCGFKEHLIAVVIVVMVW